MARTLYAGRPGDYFVDSAGRPLRRAAAPVYQSADGSQPVTDLLDEAGLACTAVTADAAGGFEFWGPENYRGVLYLRDQNGRYKLVEPADMAARVEDLETSLDATVAAALVSQVPAVLGVLGAIANWAPGTVYTIGNPVLNPEGDVARANAAHTSTSVYDPTKWTLSTTVTAVAGKAPLASPALTGTPTIGGIAAETVAGAQAKADAAAAALVAAAPGALDTLNELAAALGDDANFAATVTTGLAGKVDKWKPATVYATAAPVLNPAGDIVTRKAAGTSRATYDATEAALWAGSGTYAPLAGQQGLSGLPVLLASGLESATVNVIGDSTGNDSNEWVYLTAQALAARYPAYTVLHRLWNDATQDYDAPTTIQTGTAGVEYLNQTTATQYARYPRGATGIVQVLTDLDVRVKCSLVDWTPAATQTLAAHWGNAAGRSWMFHVKSTGVLELVYSADGTASSNFISSTVAPTVADGATLWVRAAFDVDNGAAGKTCTFYTSTDGTTWTVLGAPVISAGVAAIFSTPFPYEIGSRTGGSETLIGKVYEVDIRDGIDGVSVAPRFVDLWTVQSGAVVVGAPVLNFVNGSMPGADVAYFSDVTRFPKMSPKGVATNLVILSCSHNDGDKRDADYLVLWDAWLVLLRARHPYATLALSTQNPETLPNATWLFHQIRRRVLMQWAANNRLPVIDAWGAFLADGRAIALLTNPADGIHPLPAGSLVWAAKVQQMIGA